jgi:RNA-directed DNA polymerase
MSESNFSIRKGGFMNKIKPFTIPKELVVKAYKLVKANAGAAGVDQQSLVDFDKDVKNNLYKIWNRLSSGSYFPPPVKAVSIPKKQGGERILGVPTISDRICQTVVKLMFEPIVEPFFHPNSYGYRPGKSALDAVGITRERCWKYDWVLEYDICGLFDNISHELLMKAVRKHTDNKCIILYIERWLKAPMQLPDGRIVKREKGTPQGGSISCVLSNLFLHYVFDAWMVKHHPTLPWSRYADDGIVHCKTEAEAQQIKEALKQRFEECGLDLHPEKTQIVYCKRGTRMGNYSKTSFEFLGYEFRGRSVRSNKQNRMFVGFTPAVSKTAKKAMCAKMRRENWRNRSDLSLNDISTRYNPVLRGWLEYYGKYTPSAMQPVLRHFNRSLVSWAMHKYKKLEGKRTKAGIFMEGIAKRQPDLFVHWERGMVGPFA